LANKNLSVSAPQKIAIAQGRRAVRVSARNHLFVPAGESSERLRSATRKAAGREAWPAAAVIDTGSVKMTPAGDPRGLDAGPLAARPPTSSLAAITDQKPSGCLTES
jgi:hypothetical protein